MSTTSRVYNIMQYEKNPKTGEDLHFGEVNIKRCISHKTIKKWAYICHDKDHAVEEDEVNGIKRGIIKTRHWHLVIKTDKALEINTLARWLGIPVQFIEKPYGGENAFLDCVEYLTHEHPAQQGKGKYRYPDEEVKANFDFRKALDDRNDHIKKYEKDLSYKQQIFHDILYKGKTIREVINEDKIFYMENFKKTDEYRMKYIQQAAPP